MPELDIFSQSPFTEIERTNDINKMPFVPTYLGDLAVNGQRLFAGRGVRTTSVWFDENDSQLRPIQSSPRGAPATPRSVPGRRRADSIPVPHLVDQIAVYADEIQDVRRMGSEQLQDLRSEVQDREQDVLQNFDLTWEHHRLGAIQGKVLDADGSVIVDLFDKFKVTPETAVNFKLNQSGTDVAKIARGIRRTMIGNLRMPGVVQFRIKALCGHDFFDQVIGHSSVKEAYLNHSAAQVLARDQAFNEFNFAGIDFVDYQADDDGLIGVPADGVRLFPMVPGIFHTYFAPADNLTWANTRGRPRYGTPYRDPQDKFWSEELQSNPLTICTRPKALMSGQAS